MGASVASLEHLTGPSGGTVNWLGETSLDISLDPHRRIHVESLKKKIRGADIVARMRRVEDGFEIEASGDASVWVNGQAVKVKRLRHLDMIEFGDAGPMSRYYLHDKDGFAHRSTTDILGDAAAYFRTSRQSFLRRTSNTVRQIFYRLTVETTVLFRLGVVVALAVLGLLAYEQIRLSKLLKQQISAEQSRLEGFSRTLARTRKEALTPADLQDLRSEMGQRITETGNRLSKLEHLSTAAQRIIEMSSPSVVFLQGTYSFKEETTDRMLRMVLDATGQPMLFPNGLPVLSPDGNGPIAERQFVGSAFLVGDEGHLLTNRHVGLPWELDGNAKLLAGQGLIPVVTKFVAYRPGLTSGEEVELIQASDEIDLALLRYVDPGDLPRGLKIAETLSRPGDQVILMGYPTGLRSLLAQAGGRFIEELQSSKDFKFWSVAERLAKAGLIVPLASRGIVGRSSEERVVYDAETTHGGSGGPVLNSDGEVVAINSAVLPEYGGSNLGVPAKKVDEFLATLSSASQ